MKTISNTQQGKRLIIVGLISAVILGIYFIYPRVVLHFWEEDISLSFIESYKVRKAFKNTEFVPVYRGSLIGGMPPPEIMLNDSEKHVFKSLGSIANYHILYPEEYLVYECDPFSDILDLYRSYQKEYSPDAFNRRQDLVISEMFGNTDLVKHDDTYKRTEGEPFNGDVIDWGVYSATGNCLLSAIINVIDIDTDYDGTLEQYFLLNNKGHIKLNDTIQADGMIIKCVGLTDDCSYFIVKLAETQGYRIYNDPSRAQ